MWRDPAIRPPGDRYGGAASALRQPGPGLKPFRVDSEESFA
jgi:hypothetical protein